MLFKPDLVAKVLRGEKTQTRRIVKPEDDYRRVPSEHGVGEIDLVLTRNRVRWEVGNDYAVCPGRGKPSIGRIRLTGIRLEDVRDISANDAIAEGFEVRPEFWNVWSLMHDPAFFPLEIFLVANGVLSQEAIDSIWLSHLRERPSERYQAWALTFELVR